MCVWRFRVTICAFEILSVYISAVTVAIQEQVVHLVEDLVERVIVCVCSSLCV